MQVNGSLMLGSTLIFALIGHDRRRDFLAGCLVAGMVSIKLNFGLLAIYCVLRSWRSAFGMMAWALVAHIALVACFGARGALDMYSEWLTLLFGQSAAQFMYPDAQGLLRALLVVTGDAGKPLWALSVVAFVVGGVALMRRVPDDVAASAAYWIAGAYLLSPLAWWYQLLFLYPAAFVVISRASSLLQGGIVWSCLTVFALAGTPLLGPGFAIFKAWNGFFVASALIFILFTWQIWRGHVTPSISMTRVALRPIFVRKNSD